MKAEHEIKSSTEIMKPPRACTFTESDWQVLSKFWYPVARSDEVSETPLAIKLLDVDLVAYRANGAAVVARDLCVHRGTPLSMGWVEGAEIVCPYHGFRFGTDGYCKAIPAHPSGGISARLKISVYPAVERYGLVWTSLAAEKENIPPFPAWEDDDYQNILPPTVDIGGSSGRQMEGFLDVAHFAWVHAESFADRNNPFVPAYRVDVTDYGLQAAYVSTVSNYPKGMQHLAPADFKWLRVYDVFPPFAARLTIHFPQGGKLWILNAACPVSARKTRLFVPIARNFDKESSLEDVYAFNMKIFHEDKAIVEAQKPEDLPLDLQEETHIAADRTSVAYRQALKRLGLGELYTS